MIKALMIIASVVLFLIAAKVHGRELRREREAAGFHHVTFGDSNNPPEVEALWKSERPRFWGVTVGAIAVALAIGLFVRPPTWVLVSAVLAWSPTLSFFVCAVLSVFRRGA